MKKLFIFIVFFAFFINIQPVSAQRAFPTAPLVETDVPATDEAEASISAEQREQLEKLQEEDVTRVDPNEERNKRIRELFAGRPIENPNVVNFIGFAVQHSIRIGVPVNTVILILLLPLLATAVVFSDMSLVYRLLLCYCL
ncbi:MAG TPA: hypothetical protein PLD54_03360 [Candidatus Levybacteria bacterium]|nr:hypothetical protein [Candidatus Levybacteria bacterium]